MAKVQLVKKSRKEHVCQRCRKVIAVGMPYYKGIINFHPDIIRCQECGLESWEVTTSDYQLRLGEIAYRWQDGGVDESSIDSVLSDLESLRDNTQDSLDNIPENLQDSPTAELLQERVDNLESVIGEVESIDLDELKSEVVSDFEDNEEVAAILEDGKDKDYDDLMADESLSGDVKGEMITALESKIAEALDEALSEAEV